MGQGLFAATLAIAGGAEGTGIAPIDDYFAGNPTECMGTNCFVAGTSVSIAGNHETNTQIASSCNQHLQTSTCSSMRALVAAKDGDINAKFRSVINSVCNNNIITLTLRDKETGELFKLSQPEDSDEVTRLDKQGGVDILTRSPSLPEKINLDRFDFPISNVDTIKPGQQVISRDPHTGKTEIKSVVRTFKHKAYELIKLELADRSAKVVECFEGTPQHPFFTTHGIVVAARVL